MTIEQFNRHRVTRVALLVALAAVVAAQGSVAQVQVVQVTPGENLQELVNANPAGTKFVLAAGVYRMQSVQPKANDAFMGAGTGKVFLNGSIQLSFAQTSPGKELWVAKATVLPQDAGVCQAAHPLCNYDQDLYVDGVPQTPVALLAGLQAGQWYFDRVAGAVYISENPAGHTMELGSTQWAFEGNAPAVLVEYMTVEEYANPAQTGAVGGYKDGNGWTVVHVESRFNHGTGIALGPKGQIFNSYIHNNGQLGISIANGSNSKVTGNELAWNNVAGYDPGWEAGGSKFWNTTNLLVESNYVHDNYGPGLWTDYNNTGTVYQSNTVKNNQGAGILHEISYAATIDSNIVENNGDVSGMDLWNAQIVLANSSGVNVFMNTVEVPLGGGQGIGLVNEQRGTGTQGPWVAAHNAVHNNTVAYFGTAGVTGIVDYLGHGTAVGNVLDYNHYILEVGGATHWMWFSNMTWPQLQSAGQEIHGRCCN
jgi:hypothetical protein